jgi:alpha-L-rhamnosidase
MNLKRLLAMLFGILIGLSGRTKCFAVVQDEPDLSKWHGQWISTDSGASAPLLRKTFAVKGKIKHATAYVSGAGYFELHLNGKKVGDHRLDPGFSDYDRRVLYTSFDVTDQLRAGENAIGVILGTGWFDVHQTNVWHWERAPWRGVPRAIVDVRVEMTDGTIQTIASDATWKCSTGGTTYDSIYGGENFDSRQEKTNWDSPAYADDAWTPAKVVEAPRGKLEPLRMPPIRVTETFKPVNIKEPKPGVFLIDLGQNIAGVPEITVKGPAGTRVKMVCGERLAPDGTIDQSKIDGFIKQFGKDEPFQEDNYTLSGQGVETWSPRFTYHGFQFIQVTGFPGTPTPENFRALAFHTDVPSVGSFECSNPLLNKIQNANRWSFVNNLESIETDCPTREKNGWTGDANLAAESAMFNFDPHAFYEKWMNDIDDAQKPDGNLPGIVPSPGWGYGKSCGPAWDSICILLPWQVYEYYGDTQILENHYETMTRYMDYLGRLQTGMIITTGLGDWCEFKAKTSNALTSTGYYFRDAVAMTEIARLLNKPEDAEKYAALAGAIRSAINAKFFDEEKNSYAEGTQTALACALHHNFAPDNRRQAIFANLVSVIEKDHRHLDCGILGTKYVMNVLIDNGRTDLAYAIMAQHDVPSWGYWIDQGATTLWEGWRDGDSHNHVMFGDVSACMFKGLAGIHRDRPGFSHVRIEPGVVGDLTWAKAGYRTIHGEIASSWKIQGDKLTLDVKIPKDVTATVSLPTSNPNSATASNGLQSTGLQPGSAVFEVGPGEYHFEALR